MFKQLKKRLFLQIVRFYFYKTIFIYPHLHVCVHPTGYEEYKILLSHKTKVLNYKLWSLCYNCRQIIF